MTLENWAHVATIVGVFTIPLSAYGIWKQLKEHTRLARIANTHAIVEMASPFNLQLIQDRQMAEYWIHGADKFATYDQVDQYRFKSLLIWWLLLHENIFFQFQSELIDPTIYATWELDLKGFANDKLKDRWPELRSSFQEDFAKHVDRFVR